jgi:hypothetical protein
VASYLRSIYAGLARARPEYEIVIELLNRGRQTCLMKAIQYRVAAANGSRSRRYPNGRCSPKGMPVSRNCLLRVSSAR